MIRSRNPSDPPSALYWVGIERRPDGLSFDAVQLVGGGVYENCGMVKVPSSVVSVGAVTRPFHARVRIQPATVEKLDGEVEWESGSEGGDTVECVVDGNLRWTSGGLAGEIARQPCAAPEEPHRIRIEPDGRIRLETPLEQKERG